jgi:hypothetical protein
MPIVSTYGPRKVGTTALPGVRQTAAETEASTGVGVDQARAAKWGQVAQTGQAVQHLGGVIGQEAITQKAEATKFAHDVALTEADNKLAAWEHQQVYDPQNGALTRKGKASLGLIEDVGDAYEKYAGEISQGLGTEEQRLDFEKIKSGRGQAMDLVLRRYVNQEMTTYATGEMNAAVTLAQNDAVANALDPLRVGRALDNATGVIEKLGPSVGMGPDAIKVSVDKVRTQTHTGVIESLLAQKEPAKARAYFEEVADQIAGEAKPRLEAMISTARVAVEGLQTAEAIWTAMGPKTETAPINIDDMETAARAKFKKDPETLERTIQFLRERKAGVDAGRKDREEANSGGLWLAVSKGASIAELTRMPAYLQAPEKLQSQLIDRVLEHTNQAASRAATAESRAASEEGRAYTREVRAQNLKERAGWARYWEEATPENLDKNTEDYFNSLRGELGDDHANRLIEGKRKQAGQVKPATIDDQLFREVARSGGLDPYKKSPTEDDKAKLGFLRANVENAIDQYQRTHQNKALSYDEKGKLMKAIVDQKVMLDWSWPASNEEKIAALVTDPHERDLAFVPLEKIPAAHLSLMLNRLRSAGVAPATTDDATLKRLYISRLQHAYAQTLMGATLDEVHATLQGNR